MRNKRFDVSWNHRTYRSLGLSAKPAGPTLKKMTEFDLPDPPGNGSTISQNDVITCLSNTTSLRGRCMSSIAHEQNVGQSTLVRGVEYVPKSEANT